jgi:hypothetical protein
MESRRFGLAVAFCCLAIGLSSSSAAYAQSSKRIQRPQMGYNPAQSQMANTLYNRPTVSPYLNLLRQQGVGSPPNYQTLVRPQLDQDRINSAQHRQMRNLQNQLTDLDRTTVEPGETIRATGHRTDFLEFRNYFGSNAAYGQQ